MPDDDDEAEQHFDAAYDHFAHLIKEGASGRAIISGVVRAIHLMVINGSPEGTAGANLDHLMGFMTAANTEAKDFLADAAYKESMN